MKTFSLFKNKELKNTENEKIWSISGSLFDVVNEKIIGFIYKKRFINYDYFLIDDIKKINKNNLIIYKRKSDLSFPYEITWKTVKNIDWKILWIVEDIEFDLMYNLKNIIIDEWYNLSSIEVINKKQISIKKNIRKISIKYIISYEKENIIINDYILLKNNKKTLDNFYKIFINRWSTTYNTNKKIYE